MLSIKLIGISANTNKSINSTKKDFCLLSFFFRLHMFIYDIPLLPRFLDLLLRHLHCTFHFEKENEFTSLRVRIDNFQRKGSSLYIQENSLNDHPVKSPNKPTYKLCMSPLPSLKTFEYLSYHVKQCQHLICTFIIFISKKLFHNILTIGILQF
ncbi:hypothetical protein BM74_18235 [Bacillus thuringiensis]|uniref:Uncharacterized protein n=2 Tax=Bacillus cereus group TaxID=86661 RepID=A0A437SGP5_BACTU|nr:conserved hypothetical protein [Bacillus thuringiensis str. Al Hakam]ACO29043.1 conserved hypothetical protein [Bacillus cereus 03BB102]EEK53815.1 hypothetical protein bcere0004_49700 [Bacillus cereus BGSC 6E1]MBR9697767.1 hypothetical protein [Bacillus cereus]RVU62913.1 hypothetical protein BM74_18235 [Bacillus thuringiensis]